MYTLAKATYSCEIPYEPTLLPLPYLVVRLDGSLYEYILLKDRNLEANNTVILNHLKTGPAIRSPHNIWQSQPSVLSGPTLAVGLHVNL